MFPSPSVPHLTLFFFVPRQFLTSTHWFLFMTSPCYNKLQQGLKIACLLYC